MEDKEYEIENAKELLKMVEEYEASEDKTEINKKLFELSDELYNKNKSRLTQPMIDVSLALYSFTEAAMSGGPSQPFGEFIPDLKNIIEG
jgi:uncharacterized protein YcbK (DUF882 family)